MGQIFCKPEPVIIYEEIDRFLADVHTIKKAYELKWYELLSEHKKQNFLDKHDEEDYPVPISEQLARKWLWFLMDTQNIK